MRALGSSSVLRHQWVRRLGTVAALLALAACAAPANQTQPAAAPTATAEAALPPPSSPAIAAQVEGMRKLGFMVGRWEGDGYQLRGPGQRVDFHQTEDVRLQLSGELMTVTGNGTVPGKPEAPSFSAFAVTTFDPATGTYRWEAFSQGSRVDTVLTVGDNQWTWGFDPAPGISVRYAATFTADEWHETGETSVDGGNTWMPTLDLQLRKVA